ncbi:MAG TPA: putative Ig domain-containing protein, partial [bacterium]|nr:putative Ig domain-containing protein [bacterium]
YDTIVLLNNNFSYSYNVIDIDNDKNLFFTKITGPDGLSISSTSGQIIWYEASPADTYTIEIAVTDTVDTIYNRFTLRVIE